MEIEIISKECIKPSSPTPHHLKTFKLSLLDQLSTNPYVPIIFYYPNDNGNSVLEALKKSLALKQSLSKTLTQFYPLAGTVENYLSIDCNDVGANYVVTLVHRSLNEFLSLPEPQSIYRFLPIVPTFPRYGAGAYVTNVQVNIFECGGIAIGLCISHKIVDAAAIYTFLKAWTNVASGSTEVLYPNLTAPSLFPAKDLWLNEFAVAAGESLVKEGKCSTKRFVFDADAIATLKAEAARNGAQNPTRVEVVSALLWKCAMAASKETCGFQKPSSISHTVNLRRKLQETLSKDFIGNLIWVATATCRNKSEITLHEFVNKLRKSISKVDGEFVKKAQGDKGYIAMLESIKEMGEIAPKGTMDNYMFTSWCKMGFYEVDFGWGKPSWVTGIVIHGSPLFNNQITLMDTKCGEGIEAWVNLDEEEMEILQGNTELLAYASLDPSPLPNDKVAALHIPQANKIPVDPMY